jgi:hypothetical protein
MSSSKADGTRRTPVEEAFFADFFNFSRLIWASPEAAWSSTSEVRGSEVFRFRFDDSSDLVLEGFTPEEVPSVAGDELRFDDLIWGR